ncbi:MAG: TetR/AcrR family transcriptional regulator [Microbacteriaceae bacterium]
MPDNAVSMSPQEALPFVRTEPIQERSAARLDALLDAAAAIVDEIGFNRLTTGLVAARAKASIGTVYRYFPDRLVLLHALRNREIQRFKALVLENISQIPRGNVSDAVDGFIDAFVSMYRNESGFQIIRFIGSENSPSGKNDLVPVGFFAREFVSILAAEFGIPDNDESIFRTEILVDTCNALVTRAFQTDPDGDHRFIDEARVISRQYAREHFDSAS